MIWSPLEEPPAPDHGMEIVKGVVIATISAVTSGFVTWWIEELKDKRKKPHVCEHCKAEEKP